MTKTRGVFAVIFNAADCTKVLLSERADDKGWCLIGGGQEPGESDEQTLIREAREEAGIEILVLYRLGQELVFKDDTALCYICEIVGGLPTPTAEARQHRFCTMQEVRQKFFQVPYKVFEDGIGMTAGYDKIALELVGPKDKLGRTGRMVWDAFSIQQEPVEVAQSDKTPFVGVTDGIEVSACGTRLVQREAHMCKTWLRLDPYAPAGFMLPAQ